MAKYMNPPEKVKQVGRKFEEALVHYKTLNRSWFHLSPDEELYAYVVGAYPLTIRVSRESTFNEVWQTYMLGKYTQIEFYAVRKPDEDS